MNRRFGWHIKTLFLQDLTNALRDNVMLYMIVAPLILAFGARLFLPSLDRMTATFAVQADVDPALVAALRQYGTVELYADRVQVAERVLRMDDVPGILQEDGEPVLLLEGTEAEEDPEGMLAILAGARRGAPVADYTWTQAGGTRSLVTEYGTMVLIMIAVLLGSVLMAFNLIEDKETRAVRALGVSPLSMLELTVARGLFAAALSYTLVIATTLIMVGPAVDYGRLTVGFLASIGLPILIGYTIGGLADNQLKAIAILKFLIMIYLTLPVVTVFLPASLHPYFYILPNYWMWVIFENVFIGQGGPVGFAGACLITLASCLALIAVGMPLMRRQLRLR